LARAFSWRVASSWEKAKKRAGGQIKEHLQICADLQKGAQSTTGSGTKR
jgi:hypothetical protein